MSPPSAAARASGESSTRSETLTGGEVSPGAGAPPSCARGVPAARRYLGRPGHPLAECGARTRHHVVDGRDGGGVGGDSRAQPLEQAQRVAVSACLLVGDGAQPQGLRIGRRDRERPFEQLDRFAGQRTAAALRGGLGKLPEGSGILPVELDGALECRGRPLELLHAEIAAPEQAPALQVVRLAREALLEPGEQLVETRRAVRRAAVRSACGRGGVRAGRCIRGPLERTGVAQPEVERTGRDRHEHRDQHGGGQGAVADLALRGGLEVGGERELELLELALVGFRVDLVGGERGGELGTALAGERDVGRPLVRLARGAGGRARAGAQGSDEQQCDGEEDEQGRRQEEEGHGRVRRAKPSKLYGPDAAPVCGLVRPARRRDGLSGGVRLRVFACKNVPVVVFCAVSRARFDGIRSAHEDPAPWTASPPARPSTPVARASRSGGSTPWKSPTASAACRSR